MQVVIVGLDHALQLSVIVQQNVDARQAEIERQQKSLYRQRVAGILRERNAQFVGEEMDSQTIIPEWDRERRSVYEFLKDQGGTPVPPTERIEPIAKQVAAEVGCTYAEIDMPLGERNRRGIPRDYTDEAGCYQSGERARWNQERENWMAERTLERAWPRASCSHLRQGPHHRTHAAIPGAWLLGRSGRPDQGGLVHRGLERLSTAGQIKTRNSGASRRKCVAYVREPQSFGELVGREEPKASQSQRPPAASAAGGPGAHPERSVSSTTRGQTMPVARRYYRSRNRPVSAGDRTANARAGDGAGYACMSGCIIGGQGER